MTTEVPQTQSGMTDTENTVPGRYGLDINNSAYADPYVFGTPYLESRKDAEALADDLIPVVNDAAKFSILHRAAQDLEHQVEAAAKGWSTGGVWERFLGLEVGDFAGLILRLADGEQGSDTETDWKTYCTVSSEERDHTWHLPVRLADDNDGCSPAYEETYQ